MGLDISEVSLTTSYASAITLRPGTTEMLIELPESAEGETLHAYVHSIGGTATGLTEGGASSAGDAWTLKFGGEPIEEEIVVYAKATAACDAIVYVWVK